MKLYSALVASAAFLGLTLAQQVGTSDPETHPSLPMETCSASGCTAEATKVTVDANWRWTHKVGTSTNCYTGNKWDESICKDPKECAANCALEGAKYKETYGIEASGKSITLGFVTKHQYGTNIGSRIYMMEDDANYKMFKLLNQEFSFEVDASKLACGLNGALYFVEMEKDGGMKSFPSNKAGAKYGTGYCDAQCPHDIKFISGEANVLNWTPSTNDVNSGIGKYGSCCAEMDIWEANKMSNAFTSHPCSFQGRKRCASDKECGFGKGNRYTGVCDRDGCDINPFRAGNHNFYGPGSNFTIDSTKPITVVTQFITDDKTANGNLVEIKRLYKQGDKVIKSPSIAVSGVDKSDSITDKVCGQMKKAFSDTDDHTAKGGLKQMGAALKNGVVLTISLWDDHEANCLWLDSSYPADKTGPGVARGTCPANSGVPSEVENTYASATVTFGNIRVGPIGSTVSGQSAATSSAGSSAGAATTAPSTTTSPTGNEDDGSFSPGNVSPPSGSSGGASTTAPSGGASTSAPSGGSTTSAPSTSAPSTSSPSSGGASTTAPSSGGATPTPSKTKKHCRRRRY